MTDRIEELQAQQKEHYERSVGDERDNYEHKQVLDWWNTALTEALDLARTFKDQADGLDEDRVNREKYIAELERLLERAKKFLAFKPRMPGHNYTDLDQFFSDLDARSVPQGQETHPGPSSTDEQAVPGRNLEGPTGDLHEQGRKNRQPWCLTHDAPMVCSADGSAT